MIFLKFWIFKFIKITSIKKACIGIVCSWSASCRSRTSPYLLKLIFDFQPLVKVTSLCSWSGGFEQIHRNWCVLDRHHADQEHKLVTLTSVLDLETTPYVANLPIWRPNRFAPDLNRDRTDDGCLNHRTSSGEIFESSRRDRCLSWQMLESSQNSDVSTKNQWVRIGARIRWTMKCQKLVKATRFTQRWIRRN